MCVWLAFVAQQTGRSSRSNSTSNGSALSSPQLHKHRNSIAVCESPTYSKAPPIKPSLVPAVGSSGATSTTRNVLLQRGESLLRKLPPALEKRLRPLTLSEEPKTASGSPDSVSSANSTATSVSIVGSLATHTHLLLSWCYMSWSHLVNEFFMHYKNIYCGWPRVMSVLWN